MHRYGRDPYDLDVDPDDRVTPPAPGRRTLTMSLPPRPHTVQARRATTFEPGAGDVVDRDALVSTAIGDAGAPLPQLDAVQARFGRHDLGGVRAHHGPAVERASTALGAEAFATGDHVAFARPPTLHTIVHEAAHVIQQRGGGVTTQGLGAADDAHERHADQVADRVVAGESVEALLDRYAPLRAYGAASVQLLRIGKGKATVGEVKGAPKKVLERLARDGFDTADLEASEREILRAAIADGTFELVDKKRTKALLAALDREDAAEAEQDDGAQADGEGEGDEGDGEDEAEAARREALVRHLRKSPERELPPESAPVEADGGGRKTRGAVKKPTKAELAAKEAEAKKAAAFTAKIEGAIESGIDGVRTSKIDPTATALSRLAAVLETAASGTTCVAVLKSGEQLVVSANGTGKAMAVNMAYMLGALQAGETTGSVGDQEPVAGYHGDQQLTGRPDEPDAKPGKAGASSAMDLASAGFTEGRGKTADPARGAARAARRIPAVVDWLQQPGNEITSLVVRQIVTPDVHAEMRLLDGLDQFLSDPANTLTAPITLGISKKCCGLCAMGIKLFKALHPGVTLNIEGVHGKTYGKWPPPRFVRDHLPEFLGLPELAGAADLEQAAAIIEGYKPKKEDLEGAGADADQVRTGYASPAEEEEEAKKKGKRKQDAETKETPKGKTKEKPTAAGGKKGKRKHTSDDDADQGGEDEDGDVDLGE